MKGSLTAKISLIFFAGFVLVCVLFYVITRMQHDRAIEKVKENHFNAVTWLVSMHKKSTMPDDLEDYFRNFDLVYVRDSELKFEILTNGSLLDRAKTAIGLVETLLYKDELYLAIKNQNFSLLLRSTAKSSKDMLIIAFVLTASLLGWVYFSMLKSLEPLKSLRADMHSFASGNMEAVCRAKPLVEGADEIAEVAYEFNNAACKIKELILSRQLFLRTIMHELKTPIGKGMIASAMLPSEALQTRFRDIFERLSILIDEFTKIEQLLSKSYALKYENYHFSLILEQVADMLMLENFDEKVISNLKSDPILRVDFQLFCLAIKNLVDNALKYSATKKAYVDVDETRVSVRNPGAPLERDIEYYKQAFVRAKVPSKPGLGLGLYIIENICEMHKFKFEYAYLADAGEHEFSIVFGGANVKAKA